MTTATKAPTKADLQAELLVAQRQLADAREQLAALSEQQPTSTDELRQTLWLNPLACEGQGRFVNPNTGKVSFRFSAVASRYDKRTEKYTYGADKYFVAYNNGHGNLADKLVEIYASDDRRIDITAFEVPWGNGTYKSNWNVTSVTVRAKPQPASTSHQEVIDPEIL